jgi:PWWP domain
VLGTLQSKTSLIAATTTTAVLHCHTTAAPSAVAIAASAPETALVYDTAALAAVSHRFGDTVWARLSGSEKAWPGIVSDPRFSSADVQQAAQPKLSTHYCVTFYEEAGDTYGLCSFK